MKDLVVSRIVWVLRRVETTSWLMVIKFTITMRVLCWSRAVIFLWILPPQWINPMQQSILGIKNRAAPSKVSEWKAMGILMIMTMTGAVTRNCAAQRSTVPMNQSRLTNITRKIIWPYMRPRKPRPFVPTVLPSISVTATSKVLSRKAMGWRREPI